MQYPNELTAKEFIVNKEDRTMNKDAFFQFISSQKKRFLPRDC